MTDNQLRKNIPVSIWADISQLEKNDREALEILIPAVKMMDSIYLDQKNNTPFYPTDLSKEEFEGYIKQHPEQESELKSPVTIIRRTEGGLRAIPYSEIYREPLSEASELLKKASQLVSCQSLKKFLEGRAQAFLSNHYRENDIDWIRVVDAPFEITIGPYEEYDDKLMALKRSFQGILGLTLGDENQKIKQYQELAKEFDQFLGRQFHYKPSGALTPMVVIDEILSSGFALLHGFKPMAYNLPNDEDIHEEVGTKKVFIKNVMDAKLENITKVIAERVLPRKFLSVLDPEVYLLLIVGHELAHGLGFYAKGKAFGELGHGLEESKADIFGILFLYFLVQKKVIKKEQAVAAAILHITDSLRQLRFGLDEAHAFGSLIQYQWLKTFGALDFKKGKLFFNLNLLKSAFEELGKQFIILCRSENYSKIKAFTERWGRVPDGLRSLLEKLQDIPVDIDPIYDY